MKALKALIWKEWREARAFIIAVLALLVASRLFLLALNNISKIDYPWWMLVIGNFIFPAGFCLYGAFVFSNEFTQETEDFLLTRSVGKRTVFLVKFLFGLIMIFLLTGIAYSLFYRNLLIFGPQTRDSISPFYLYVYALPFLAGLYCLFVCNSLILRKSLTAILSAPFLLLPVVVCAFPYIGMSLMQFRRIYGNPNFFTTSMLPMPMLVVLLFQSIYLWETSITKGKNSWVQFLKCSAVILLISWGSHFCLYLYSGYQVNKSIQRVKTTGLKWGWVEADVNKFNVLKPKIINLKAQAEKIEEKYESVL